MNTDAIEPMAISDLAFDFRNPRLPEFGLTNNSSEEEVIRVLCEAMDVRELVMSIAASGFFPTRAFDSGAGGGKERRYRREPPSGRSQGSYRSRSCGEPPA